MRSWTGPARLGQLERAVMDQLWSMPDGGTVRQIQEAVTPERAYTTVMTVLDRLAGKGIVDRERRGRAWHYSAAHTHGSLTGQAMRHSIDQIHADDRKTAILHFLEGASVEEIHDLRTALAELEARVTAQEAKRPKRRR